jgi:outer membrane protein assembly factor BamB
MKDTTLLSRPWMAFLSGVICLLGVGAVCFAADWTHWRGPWQTGVSPEKDLPASWSPTEADGNLIWKAPYGCRSTPLVMNGRVYLINAVGNGITQQERVMCLDADTGKLLWERSFNVFHVDIVSVRLGWANLAGDPKTGNIYGHGTQGLFFCYDKDGNLLWSHSLIEEYGRFTGYGGRVTTPTVDGDLVIVGMINSSWGDQKGGNRWLAVDKMSGTPVWWSEPGGPPKDSFYAVPVVGVINGERLLIVGGAEGSIHALKVRTGEKVWSYPLSVTALNSSPVLQGSLVYMGHGLENADTQVGNIQGRVVCLDASKVEDGKPALVWKRDGIKARYASPIIDGERLYVPDEFARLHCLDAKNGKTLWRYSYGRNARGSPVLADGKIYVGEVNSRFYILQPGPKKCKLLHEQFFPSPDGTTTVEINGTPAVANGRIYFGTAEGLYCIGKKGVRPAPEPVATAAEEPADASARATHLQIVPADVVLYPGESTSFKVRAFDSRGRFLREVQAAWSLPVPIPVPPAKTKPPALKGDLVDGKLTVSAQVPNQQGYVLAKAEGLSARARVRVVPKLPYREDFERYPVGSVPGGWVNTQGKFVIAAMKDGTKVLKKVNTKASPLVARGNAFIGMPGLKDYTIQADVMGTKANGSLPEMGVVANRYTLVLAGNIQKLRILSWDALPRVDETISYPWQPNVWYRMKLTVDIQGDKGIVRGKVWRRDQPEPEAWTVQTTDPRPDVEGSPALYGYVTGIVEGQPGTDIYYDNVSVAPNKK